MSSSEGPDAALHPDLVVNVQLAGIARVLLSPGTVAEILQRIVTLSIAAIDGCDECGVCATADVAAASTPGSTLMAELDAMQLALGEGPCPDALSGVDCVYVPDLTEDSRWPRFGPLAASVGLRSALGYRLFAGEETFGALQLYARLPAGFNATERAQGLLFAAHAGVALSVAQHSAVQLDRVDQLQAALRSRDVIGQAQGILMERERITADQAFDLLRRSSQHLNVKLRVVAQQLVDTGAAPDQGSTTS